MGDERGVARGWGRTMRVLVLFLFVLFLLVWLTTGREIM